MAHLISGETFRAEYQTPAQSVTARFAGPSSHTAQATQSGNTWSVRVQTDGWPAGLYWVEIAAQDAEGNKWVVSRDRLELKPALSSMPEDSMTDTERMVQMLESCLAGNASEMVQSYKINNRELSRYSLTEIRSLLAFYRNRLVSERRKARGQIPNGPSIRIRF